LKASTRTSFVLFILLCLAALGRAQRVAIITPDNAETSKAVAERLANELAGRLKVIDSSMAAAAFSAAGLKTPFNLSTEESKRLGQSIGAEFFVLLRSAVQRRSSFERPEYYEAYAAVFLVSGRSGRLVFFTNMKHEADNPQLASEQLERSIRRLAEHIADAARSTQSSELSEPPISPMDEPPDPGSPAANGFKAPIPFQRLKPEYTDAASLYNVEATVEVTVDLASDGKVLRTNVTRWAGYGLDGSAVTAIRAMNWRPAELDGKFLPMRFLVRYNFKKPERPSAR